MKIKTLLISLSIIGFLSFSLASCSDEQDMGIGETGGKGPDGYVSSNSVLDSIPFPKNDSIAILDLPKD